jgi:hypothetical protein
LWLNHWALSGDWTVGRQAIVLIDGQPPGLAPGIDVDERGSGTIVEPRLYQLIRQPEPLTDRQFEIEFLDSGVKAFSFTFGRSTGQFRDGWIVSVFTVSIPG